VRPLGVLRGGHAGTEHKRSILEALDWPTGHFGEVHEVDEALCANNGSGCHIHSAMK
jgi:hypothetical protein